MTANTSLLQRAEAWAAHDPDPETRSELRALLGAAAHGEQRALAEVAERFDGWLRFGTAGLRAELGAGPRRMNRVVVAYTSAALAQFLVDRQARAASTTPAHREPGTTVQREPAEQPEPAPATATAPAAPAAPRSSPHVVIGFDGRTNSAVFAREAAEVLSGAGLRVTLLAGPAPTPLTAFATRHLRADAGVMITASHNPPRDNGYKLYLGGADGGRQITAPDDRALEALTEQAYTVPMHELPRSTDYLIADATVADAYVEAVSRKARDYAASTTGTTSGSTTIGTTATAEPATGHAPKPAAEHAAEPAPDLRIVYTAMHGVGDALTRRVFRACGLPALVGVTEQAAPDEQFPTLEYPNPEEPGALELAFALARAEQADLVIAHDPDADRLAVAIPRDGAPGGYERLSGNELGLLLGWRAAECAVRASEATESGSLAHLSTGAPMGAARGALACTLVSSPALGAVAAHFGLQSVETLPGFKWVARVPGLIFGYEESLGYLTHPEVLGDKDGISAAVAIVQIARNARSRGLTLWQLLDEASERFGHFASAQLVLRLDSSARVDAVMEALRADPPLVFGGSAVVGTRDYLAPGDEPVAANILRYDLACGSRVMVRPSGTEPKLKIYLDACADEGTLAERQSAAAARLRRIEHTARDIVSRFTPRTGDDTDAKPPALTEPGAA